MEEKKEPRPAIVHHGPQAQDKSCSRGLVMTWFLPRPWPAFHGQLGPGVGLFIRLGVGYARVVWDVRGWYGMYSRLDFSGYVRKYALCRRGMVAGRSPLYLRLRVHKKAWHLRKYAQRGGVWWQGDRCHTFAFEPAEGTMWMTYTKRPDFKTLQTRWCFSCFR